MTNREWLQTLTDEEFAKWHVEIGCGSCVYNPEKGFCKNLLDISSFEDIYGVVKKGKGNLLFSLCFLATAICFLITAAR